MATHSFGARLRLTVLAVATFGGLVVATGGPANGAAAQGVEPCAATGYAARPARCGPRPVLPPPTTGSPDATLSKSARGPQPWAPGSYQWFDFTVTNVGTATTQGAVTITDDLASALSLTESAQYSGTGWSCVQSSGGRSFTCTYPYLLAPGASAPPLAVRVKVDPSAPGAGTINFASVATAGDANAANNSANTGYIRIAPPPPPPPPPPPADLQLTKYHQGNFVIGQPGVYIVQLINFGGEAKGPIVMTDVVPAGLRVVNVAAGVFGDWSCTVAPADISKPTLVTCTLSANAAATDTTMFFDHHADVNITVVPEGLCAPNVPAVVRINTASVAAPVNGDANMADNRAEDYTIIECTLQPAPIVPAPALDVP